MHKTGETVKVWVLLKQNGKIIDTQPHIIQTKIINGINSVFSRDIKFALCGKSKKPRTGWRVYYRGKYWDKLDPPEAHCETCLGLAIMQELAK